MLNLHSRDHRGLSYRRVRNASLRAIGEEPPPGLYAGVKRMRRYLGRLGPIPVRIDPERALRYLHKSARDRAFAEAAGIA